MQEFLPCFLSLRLSKVLVLLVRYLACLDGVKKRLPAMPVLTTDAEALRRIISFSNLLAVPNGKDK